MKYVVTHDCFGFRGEYWVTGEVVNVFDDETPPIHFSPWQPKVLPDSKEKEIVEPKRPTKRSSRSSSRRKDSPQD